MSAKEHFHRRLLSDAVKEVDDMELINVGGEWSTLKLVTEAALVVLEMGRRN